MGKEVKVGGKNRATFVAGMIGKGEEYLAGKLFDARAENNELRNMISKFRMDRFSASEEAFRLRKINYNLAKVLQDVGIRPTKLRITYQVDDCPNCEYAHTDDGYTWECNDFPDVGCPQKTIVETESFYDYSISDDGMSGITAGFGSEEYDVLKVVDERTGEVIYERKKENEA